MDEDSAFDSLSNSSDQSDYSDSEENFCVKEPLNFNDLGYQGFQEEQPLLKDEEILFMSSKLSKLDENASSGALFQVLQSKGILQDDPRLKSLIQSLKDIQSTKNSGKLNTIFEIKMGLPEFSKTIRSCQRLISKVIKGQVVIPDFKKFCENIQWIYNKCKEETSGKPADYIPQLARADPTKWGVSLCTIDGQRFSVGDTKENFSMQSASNPFTYGLCSSRLGCDEMKKYIGHEPSGGAFNQIVLDNEDKPHNPMVNSGAIMSAALLLHSVDPDLSLSEKFEFVRNFFIQMAGGMDVGFQTSTFLSERDSADRNFALAYFMREKGCFPKLNNRKVVIQDILDLYFQTCSLEMNCESLSIMAGTLANGGTCPITGEQVLDTRTVQDILSLMYSCGMYNYSGQFSFEVGLPAKSGVSGVVVLIVPDVVGFAMYSPNLDHIGNSIRGVLFAQELVKMYNFHTFQSVGFKKKDQRSVSIQDESTNTAMLLQASFCGDEKALAEAYASGMNMNKKDYDKRTALHLACCEGHVGCVKFLIDVCHVDIEVKDRWGSTPLDEANRYKHKNIVQILKKHLTKLQEQKLLNGTLNIRQLVIKKGEQFPKIQL